MLIILEYLAVCIGLVMITIGAICDLIAAIGINRFPNFYVRMHAATVGVIGGAVIPLIGISLIALVSDQLGVYRYAVAGISFLTALIIMIVAPTGTHILAYATHEKDLAPIQPAVIDKLSEKKRGKQ